MRYGVAGASQLHASLAQTARRPGAPEEDGVGVSGVTTRSTNGREAWSCGVHRLTALRVMRPATPADVAVPKAMLLRPRHDNRSPAIGPFGNSIPCRHHRLRLRVSRDAPTHAPATDQRDPMDGTSLAL